MAATYSKNCPVLSFKLHSEKLNPNFDPFFQRAKANSESEI